MCVCVSQSVCVCLAVNSPACYIWIVNDIKDSNICFLFQVFFLLFCFGIVCVRWCVCVREYVCAYMITL